MNGWYCLVNGLNNILNVNGISDISHNTFVQSRSHFKLTAQTFVYIPFASQRFA